MKIIKIESIVTYVDGFTYGRRYDVIEQDVKSGETYVKIINDYFKEVVFKDSWGYYDDITIQSLRDEKLEKLFAK